MTPLCRRCHELVDPHGRLCPACGADLKVQVPLLVDLTARGADAERERNALLAAVVAAGTEAEPTPRPGWGANTPAMLELELAPIRIAPRDTSSGATATPAAPARPTTDDVLPTLTPSRRGWRRR
jgi:hypothetical protein